MFHPIDDRFEYFFLRDTSEQFPEIVDLHQSFNVFKRILEEVWGSSDLGEIVPHERVDGCDKITAGLILNFTLSSLTVLSSCCPSPSWTAWCARVCSTAPCSNWPAARTTQPQPHRGLANFHRQMLPTIPTLPTWC